MSRSQVEYLWGWDVRTGVSTYLASGDGGGREYVYLCQCILLLWRQVYVSKENVVLDRIRERSRV
jgi:hypothetical protein